jgi:7-cyano-7-deazaguanine synthase in queuosine biosynthesis
MLLTKKIARVNPLDYGSILLFSGGLDSAVAAKMLSLSGQRPLLVFVGQGFRTHAIAAEILADSMNLDLFTVDMSGIIEPLANLCDSVNPGSKFIPGYRMFAWQVALSVAVMFDISVVCTGEYGLAIKPESNPEVEHFAGYLSRGTGIVTDTKDPDFMSLVRQEGKPETRMDLSHVFCRTYKAGSDDVQMVDPLFGLDKAGVIRLGFELGLQFELTSTCRTDDLDSIATFGGRPSIMSQRGPLSRHTKINCGRTECHFCSTRRAAFKLSGVVDPTLYVFDERLDSVHVE